MIYFRVDMSVIFSDISKIIKDGNTKQLVVSYAPRLFKIKTVIHKRNKGLERNEYNLIEVETGLTLGHKKS